MEVECKWEPLESRVKHIVKRALGVVAPLGRGGMEEGDFMGEIEGFVDGVKGAGENGVVKMEDED